MGYTHYFNFVNKQEDINVFCLMDIKKIFKKYKNVIEVKQADYDCICFNGKGEYGCEDFYITPDSTNRLYCKTNHKEYDIIVCEVLLVLKAYYREEFYFSSDAFWVTKEDWNSKKLSEDKWLKGFEEINKEFEFRYQLIPKETQGKYYFDIIVDNNTTLGYIQRYIQEYISFNLDVFNLELKVVDKVKKQEQKVYDFEIENHKLVLFV